MCYSYIGDLNRETIHDIWNGPAIKEILNNLIPICQEKGYAGDISTAVGVQFPPSALKFSYLIGIIGK